MIKIDICNFCTSFEIEQFKKIIRPAPGETRSSLSRKSSAGLIMICKFFESEPEIPGVKIGWLPYLGNLAMAKACMATLDKKAPSFKSPKVKEALVPEDNTIRICLRVTIPLRYISQELHKQLHELPQSSLKLEGEFQDLPVVCVQWLHQWIRADS